MPKHEPTGGAAGSPTAPRTPVRRRSVYVAAPIAALLVSSGLSGCSSNKDPDHAAVCVDQQTQERLEDDECERAGATYDNGSRPYHHNGGSSALMWYFIGRGSIVPPIGGRIDSTALTRRPSGSIGYGFDRSGGTVKRGGFGKSGSKGFSGKGWSSGG